MKYRGVMLLKNKINLIHAPFDVGQPYTGVRSAPEQILTHEFIKTLKKFYNSYEEDRSLTEFRQISPNFKTMNEFLNISEKIFHKTFTHSQNENFSLTIGGDHSIAFGSIAGILQNHPNLNVIWFDAHGDMNTPDTSLSGNFHGMPLAALLNQKSDLWLNHCPWFKNKLQPSRLVLVGIRDLDPAEEELIKNLSIKVFTSQEIKNHGMNEIWNQINLHFSQFEKSPLHLSFDIDGIDPRLAPATGTPVLNGVSTEDTLVLLKKIAQSSQLISMDLVEINPSLPIAQVQIQKTIKLSQKIILEALGISTENLEYTQLPSLDHPEVNHVLH